MSIQFRRLLGVDAVGRVDDVAVNDELAYIVKVSGNRDAFDLLLAPAHLSRDYLAVLAHALRVPLGVLVLAINRRRERAYGVAVDGLQVFVEPTILFRASLHFT